jgi:hypothetical protein
MMKNLCIIKKHSLFIVIVVIAFFFTALEPFIVQHDSSKKASLYKNLILGSQIITRADALSACTVNCFAFNYSKSGGLRSAHDAILYKSDTNELIFHTSESNLAKRQLSDSEINNLKQIISDNVFELNAYKSSRNAADFYNYTLTVLLNGDKYRASWTDASAGVPVGLLEVKREIEKVATSPK